MGENLENNEWVKGDFPGETGFTTPDNYFAGLTERINARVFMEQMKSTAPANGGFRVPAGYFEDLTSAILAKTTNENALPQRKIVRLWHSKLLKYASAACFLLIAGSGLYFNIQQQPVNYADLAAEQMLYDIDEQVIIEHIEANQATQPKSSAADAELENYILNNYSQNDLVTGL